MTFCYGSTFEQSFLKYRNEKTANYSLQVPLIPLDKPMCLSEFGFNSAVVTADKQAEWMQKTVDVMNRYPQIERAFLYDLQDDNGATSENKRFGMLDVDMNPKPLWSKHKNFPR